MTAGTGRTPKVAAIAALVLVAMLLIAAAVAIAPHRLPAGELASPHRPDLANGRTIFLAGNCAGCHATPGQPDPLRLGGGRALSSPFGVFVVPNISPDRRAGIGQWTEADFVNAMKRGVDRDGRHLYPAFPYPAYARLRTEDVRDLFAYLRTLPASASQPPGHRLHFPYSIRPAVGVWKLLAFRPETFSPDPARDAAWNRGAYLVEAAAHCAECHTPRDRLGRMDRARRYAGAPNLEAGGRFAPNITPHPDGLADWSAADIADFLKTGTDKCFNEPSGMASVLASTRQLNAADNDAMARYLATLPPRAGNGRHKTC